MGPMMQPRRTFVAAAVAGMLAACSGGSPSQTIPSTATAAPSPPEAAGPSAPIRPSTPPTPSPEPTPEPVGDEPPALTLTLVGSGFASPIGIAAAPDGWLLVNERNGRVVALAPATGEVALAADMTDRVRGDDEQGLLGLALHPAWPDVPRAFVHYTDLAGDTVVSELAGSQPPGAPPTLDPASEQVLLRVDQPHPNHNGGQLAFGPDGLLYLGLGDGGSRADPHGHGQDPETLLGSVLRLDVEGASDEGYAIPEDNPFADGEGGAPEVFLYGLRNPWRFSFDRATGLLWIADVGQDAYEEVDRVDPVGDAGANLGWNRLEASHCFIANCSSDGTLLPVAEYGRDAGCSVTGGYVYRGIAIDGLSGWYVFGDYCTGLVFALASDTTGGEALRLVLETGLNLSTFGEAADGELYLADLRSGAIYRIDAGG
jgi:glucose/arabinose dehydrogenase